MSRIAVCTDSSALLAASEAVRREISVVPVSVALDGQPFDESEEGVDGFYERVLAGARATTAQPSPGQLLEAYEAAASEGASEVLSIHLDARVSGTVASAELAAREAPIPVTVVDAGTVSFGVAVCVRAAAEAVSAGAPVVEAARAVRRLGASLRNVFVARSPPEGRVQAGAGWAILEFADGATRPLAESGSVEDAAALMAEQIARSSAPVRAAVGHAAAASEPGADALARSLESSPRVVRVERYRVGPPVGAHTGPHSFGAFWWPSE